MRLLIEQLKTVPSSPKISSSLAMSPTSPPASSYFGQSFTSRLGTSTGIASPLPKRRPSTDGGMSGFTRSKSIREQWVPLKRVLTGESILEGGKDKNAAWKMIIIQTVGALIFVNIRWRLMGYIGFPKSRQNDFGKVDIIVDWENRLLTDVQERTLAKVVSG